MRRWKPVVMGLCLVVMAAPWLTGGRDLTAMVIDLAAAVIALFLLWSLPLARARRDWVVVAGGLFVAWGGLSLLWSVNRYQTLLAVIPLILALAAVLIARYLSSLEWPLRWLAVGYLVVATAASGYGFWLYLTASYDRLTSSFYWANPFAAYLIPALIVSAWWFARRDGKWPVGGWPVWLAGVAAVINGAAFWLTTSRGASLALVVVMVLAVAITRLGWWFWIKIVCVMALAFGLSLGVNAARNHLFQHTVTTVGTRFAQTVQEEGTSDASDRWNFLRSSLDIWRTSPLLGTGAGTFPTMHPQYQVRVVSASASAHNFYAQTAAELGGVGAALLAITVLGLLWRAWQRWRAGFRGGGVTLAAILALVLHFGLDIDARYPALLVLAAVLVGVAMAGPAPAATARPVQHRLGWVLGCLLVLTPIVASLYYTDQSFADGTLHQAEGNYAAAAASFKQAHQAVAYNPDNWTAEGIIYYALAQNGQDPALNLTLARDRALEAMRQDPHDAQHVFLLARVERLAGDLKGAEQAYHQALDLDPYDHPMYYADLADLYIKVGQLDSAALYINRGLLLYPDSVVANRAAEAEVAPEVARLYVERATLELTQGDQVRAKADARRALKLDAVNAIARQLLSL